MADSTDTGRLGGQKRGIKSYVLRQGRLTPGQSQALESAWPEFGLSSSHGLLDIPAVFGRTAPLTLEIGFGMGDSLVEQAVANPANNYIGIEVHRPGVGHLLIEMQENACDNIRVFSEDSIVVLDQAIPDSSVDILQLFFPDPWPKKRHHKRRIVSPAFIKRIRKKLATNGLFHFATDWVPYAEYVEELFSGDESFEVAAPPKRPETKFEKRGKRLDHEIRDLAYRLR